MKLDEILLTLPDFKQSVESLLSTPFVYNIHIQESLFKKIFRNEIPSDRTSKMNGVYFFTDEDNTILYIGKATKNNLEAEAWEKICAPVITDTSMDTPKFVNCKFVGRDPSLDDVLTEGNFKISVITLENKELSSLLEVFLQTKHFVSNNKLPVLNKQIG